MSNEDKVILKRGFGVIEILIVIVMSLVGWNLKETIELGNTLSSTIALVAGVKESTNLRINFLEQSMSRGERFTAADGRLLKSDITHVHDEAHKHFNKADPILLDVQRYLLSHETKE